MACNHSEDCDGKAATCSVIPTARMTVAADHQCPATREAQRVIVALLCDLRKDLTTSGHLAQRVTHEHLGYCNWRGESPLCTGRWALIASAVSWIDAYAVDQTEPAAVQLTMLESEVAV